MARMVWQRRHGHRIDLFHAAATAPRTATDPAGGLRLEHPSAPLECHPDAFFLCQTCKAAWLVDAKRYSSSLDAEVAKDELRTQLAFNLAVCRAASIVLPTDEWTLSETAIGAVLRIEAFRQKNDECDEWLTRAVPVPDCLEVPVSSRIEDAIVRTCTEWMERYVLPWFEGKPVPGAPPVTYEDICLLWPRPTPDKVLENPGPVLIALVDEHALLTDVEQGAHLPSGWMPSSIIEARRKELRTAILLETTDHEAIAPAPDADVIATLKADQYGNRHIRYAVKTYNQHRRAALKRAAREKNGNPERKDHQHR